AMGHTWMNHRSMTMLLGIVGLAIVTLAGCQQPSGPGTERHRGVAKPSPTVSASRPAEEGQIAQADRQLERRGRIAGRAPRSGDEPPSSPEESPPARKEPRDSPS